MQPKAVECYCVKCKTKVQMKNPTLTQTKRGTYMYKGKCSKCDGNTAAITKKPDHNKD